MASSDTDQDDSFSPKPDNKIERSYEDDSFETAEESILADPKSSPVVWGRRESVFLAESSTSSEDIQSRSICTESYETAPVVTVDESASTITEEPDYSDEFDSTANFSEEELSLKDEGSSVTIEEKAQGNFIRKKFAVLSSIQPGTKTQNYYEKREDKEVNGNQCQEMKNFCSRKLEIVKMYKEKAGRAHSGQRMMSIAGGQLPVHVQDKPIEGNKRKIENLRIENLINRAGKLKEHDFHNPRRCSDCRKMKSSVASNMFLKRKLEIAKRAEFEERLQLHLYHKDSATLLAEIVNSCTKASAPPSEVWEKLLHKESKK